MTHRERILAAIRGDIPDRLPWVPRLDLWYKANRHNGTLPPEWAELSLPEIARDLGVDYILVGKVRWERAAGGSRVRVSPELIKVTPGAADKSYGIEVARLAGMPREVLLRANKILERLERKEIDLTGRARRRSADEVLDEIQKSLF